MDKMTDPNANCDWDQRIPNEPIFERNFLLYRPETISQERPMNSDQCTPINKPWLLMSRKQERNMANWWLDNVHNTAVRRERKHSGVSTNKRSNHTLKTLLEQYPDRPWLNGIHKDITAESHLRNNNYYNPKDCIVPCVQHDIDLFARIRDEAFTRDMISQNQRPVDEMKMWNNITSPRMLEPY